MCQTSRESTRVNLQLEYMVLVPNSYRSYRNLFNLVVAMCSRIRGYYARRTYLSKIASHRYQANSFSVLISNIGLLHPSKKFSSTHGPLTLLEGHDQTQIYFHVWGSCATTRVSLLHTKNGTIRLFMHETKADREWVFYPMRDCEALA